LKEVDIHLLVLINQSEHLIIKVVRAMLLLLRQGDGFKLIRFGMQGAQTKRPRKGESDADKAKRRSFKARHAKNIAKGKTSAAYWAE
jgi:hypothetical protein